MGMHWTTSPVTLQLSDAAGLAGMIEDSQTIKMDLLATWYAQKAQNGTMSQVCVLVAFLVSELRSQVGWPKLFLPLCTSLYGSLKLK